ncbi:MAG: 3'-5' exonuclease [Bacteroidales bacterium]|nr:3'-5' exonuclease [Bacteroidales bacterium]MBQ9311601.1 3'-5' exonuclease [Bacteroidales bacterium]
MFSYTAIDFETANAFSPCSLGLAKVVDNEVIEVKNWLIKPSCFPYFHYYAQKIHGIHKEDVENEPTFDILWEEIKPYIENTMVIAHNASFDINVLRKTLHHYGIAKPRNSHYLCTYVLSRQVWADSKKFSLDFLCRQENIQLNHHHSDSDAEACARLFLKEVQYLNVEDFAQLKSVTKRRYNKI